MRDNDLYSDVITCSNCGAINIEGKKRCVRCGKRLHSPKKQNNILPNVVTNTVTNTVMTNSEETSDNNRNDKNSSNDLIAFMASDAPINQNSGPFSFNDNTVTQTMNNSNNNDSNNNDNNHNYNQFFTQNVIKPEEKVVKNTSIDKINYLSYIINSFLKPFDRYKNEENNFDLMNTGILTGIMSIIMSIVSLFIIVINIVRVNSIFSGNAVWKFDRLANINYFKILFICIFMFIGIFVGIALVYYFASSIILKKKSNLFKLLGATVTACIPLVVAIFIGQILALISSFLGLIVVFIGSIYAFMILIGLINYNIDIDSDDKGSFIYFNSICLSVIVLIFGSIFYGVISSFFSGFIA